MRCVPSSLVNSPRVANSRTVPSAYSVQARLRVRRLLRGLGAEIAADRADLHRVFLLVQPPARDVELVRALVARVAVAVVPVPVPVVVEAVSIEGPLGCWPEPQVVVDFREVRLVVGRLVVRRPDRQRELLTGRHRAVGVLADRGARLEAQAAGHVDLADAAVLHVLDRLANGGPAAVHRADLDELVEPCRRLDHLAPFPHGV